MGRGKLQFPELVYRAPFMGRAHSSTCIMTVLTLERRLHCNAQHIPYGRSRAEMVTVQSSETTLHKQYSPKESGNDNPHQ